MSSFYAYAGTKWGAGQSLKFGVVPEVLMGTVLPLPTFWL
jgi:hypothetical protein